ncbi:hypothetical protein Tco_0461831 [Tanacetum coccineum]
MDSENDNDKVNMPLLPSPKPTISYFDDLEFFKDFENEFPAIVYNDAQTSKSDLLTEPILIPQHIDEFNLKDETSLSECDEEEQNVLNFNDLFPFNVIYLDKLKIDTDNDNDKVDIKHSSGDLSVKPLPDVGAYAHGSNKLLETSINDPKRQYGFKPGLLGKSVSLGVDISNCEMFDDDWGLESKKVAPLEKELSLFDRPNKVERCRILEAHRLESILQQQISQCMAPSHHDGMYRYYYPHLNSSVRGPSPLSVK